MKTQRFRAKKQSEPRNVELKVMLTATEAKLFKDMASELAVSKAQLIVNLMDEFTYPTASRAS